MTCRRGFILLIVVAILGTLAMVALALNRSAQTSMALGVELTSRTRARMIARSGIEALIQESLARASDVYSLDLKGPVGVGTFRSGGDSYSAQASALEGRININDGVLAGQLEAAATPGFSYDSSAIDPWPTPGYVTDDSALINLRLRRLLNSYGDAHAYLDTIFDGDTSLPTTNASQPFTFTSTCNGLRGQSLPARNAAGTSLTIPSNVIDQSTGLGDRIIANRPLSGYRTVSEIMGILDAWGTMHLSAAYLNGRGFSEIAEHDLTAKGFVDTSFSRMTREIGYLESDYFMKTSYVPTYLDSDPPDFTGFWRPHGVAPVNFNAASQLVRAALFYSLTNVTFVGESNQSVVATPVMNNSTQYVRMTNYSMPRPAIGVAGVVFDEDRLKENNYPGVPSVAPSPANVQRYRFMSLYDAFHLSKVAEQWVVANSWLRDFEDFERMLAWKRTSSGAPDYERAQPAGTPYDSAFTYNPGGMYTGAHPNAGLFVQDYVEKTLPHVMSLNRRLPGWLGAPSALLSPVTWLEPEFEWFWIFQFPPSPADHGRYPDRKAEDFVWRFPHSKIKFLPSGRYYMDSIGMISADGTTWSSSIKTEIELFSTTVLRSQQDLETYTDVSSSVDIRIGPEFTSREGGVQPADTDLGFVGLKDRIHTPEGGAAPTIALNFTKDATLSSGSAPPANETLSSPHINVLTPDADGLVGSGLEDHMASMFATGSSANDISPFGGVFLGPRGHGPFARDGAGALDSFQDSLYWRLDDPANPLINTGLPYGETMRKGFISLWFRIPTAHDSAAPSFYSFNNGSGWNSANRMQGGVTYHNLVNMTFWQRSRLGSGNSSFGYNWFGPYDMPMSVEIGYEVNPWDKKRFVTARINQPRYVGYLTFAPFSVPTYSYSGIFPIPQSPDNTALTTQTDFARIQPAWGNPTWPDPYVQWKTLVTPRYHAKRIELKDIPEAGPGTWHRLAVGWDLTWNYSGIPTPIQAVTKMWARLRNESCVQNYNDFIGPTFILGDQYLQHAPIYDSHNTLSLGETHMRWRVAVDQTVNSEATVPTVKDQYFPGWRANTLIDNVRVTLGSVPGSHDSFTAAAFDSETAKSERYDLGSEPEWIVDPGLPAGSRILAASSRVYFPPDSNGNVADVDLDVLDSVGTVYTAVGPTATDKPAAYFTNLVPSAGWKIRLKYRNSRRDGTGSLVTTSSLGGSGDDVTAIPWIQDLRLLHRKPGQMSILSWQAD